MNDTSAPPSVRPEVLRGAAGSRRHTAAGKKLNYALGFGSVVALYVGWILMTPVLAAYELEAAMRPICVTYMNAIMAEGKQSERSLNWRHDWESKFRGLGISMREDQWAFTHTNPCNRKQCGCTAEAVFEMSTPWMYLDDILDVPPYKSTHHLKRDVEWKPHY